MRAAHKPTYQRVRIGTGAHGQPLYGFTLRCRCRFAVNVGMPKSTARKIYLDHIGQAAVRTH